MRCSHPSVPLIILAAVMALIPRPALGLGVTSTTPARYELHVSSVLSQIEVVFDAAPLAPTAGAVRVAGTMSGLHEVTTSVASNVLTINVKGAWQRGELVNVNLRSDLQTGASDFLLGGYYFAFTISSGAAGSAWSTPLVYGAAMVPYFIYGGDLDGDGTPDVAAPNEGTDDFSVFLNVDGNGVFPGRSDYGVGNTPSSIFGEDFDNDGDVDLATADISSGTLSVALNNGDGTFAPRTAYAAGTVTRQVHGADFDGDNDVDLCTTSKATKEIFLFENLGSGVFAAGVPYADVRPGPFAIRAGDFNGDGHADIAVACQDADSVSVLTNDGLGGFSTTGSFKVGDGAWDLNANDMDGDGDCDLVTVTVFNNRIQVLQNDGTGAFPTKLGRAAGLFPLGLHIADLDGDGDVDAISSNFNSSSASVFLNDGAGGLSLSSMLPVDRTGSYAWAHDLDGDGDLDISVVDELGDSLFVFYRGDPPPVGVPGIAGGRNNGRALVEARPNPALAIEGTSLYFTGLAGHVTVDVFTVSGRRVRRLHAGPMPPSGVLPWDGTDANGRTVASGLYLVDARGSDARASGVIQLRR